MASGKDGSDKKLHDLQRGKGALDGVRHAITKGRDSVVGVLGIVSAINESERHKRTIKAWIPELTKANIQMAGDMKRMPAHMDSIAPAWWYFWRVVLRFPFARMMAVSSTS